MSISDSLISVVIPTRNEERLLPGTLTRVRHSAEAPSRVEVIVADGGSTDNTRDSAQRHRAIMVTDHPPPAHRAAAMNLGAHHSVGQVILFLHADVKVPPKFDRFIRNALVDPAVVGGVFRFQFEYINTPLWLAEKLRWLQFKLGGVCLGQQGIFVRRDVFESLGGFPDMPDAEDVAFGRMLRDRGQVVMVPESVRVSIRHCQRQGAWRALGHDIRRWWRTLRGGYADQGRGEKVETEAS